MKESLSGLLAALLVLAPVPAAFAHEQGDFFIRAGHITTEPHENSEDLRIGGANTGIRVGVNSDSQLGLTFNYMIRDHWGVELLAATPFRHELTVQRGGALNGDLADVKHLPPTLSLLYFPAPTQARLQPYFGAGLNFTWLHDEEFTSGRKAAGFDNLDLDNSWGLAGRLGMDYQLSDRVYLNAAAWWIDIDTTARFTLGGTASRVDVELDPWVYMVGLAYRY